MSRIPHVRPDDRVLVLGIPEAEVIPALAAALSQGLAVVIAGADAIAGARKEWSRLDNVMFVPGSPAEIPWSDGFFSVVIDCQGDWPDADRVRREIARVTIEPAPESH